MAIIKQGILGGFSGKVANVTGSSWKGRAVVKGRPLSVANPRTAGQVTNRSAFKACTQFASLILTSLIIPLMNRFAGNISGYNKYVSLNKNYFDETGLITQANMNFGTGKLGETPIAVLNRNISGGSFDVSWDGVLDNSYKLSTDWAYALFINRTTGEILFQGNTTNDRSVEEAGVDIATATIGDVIDCWVTFLRADGTQVGNTAYVSATLIA